MAYAPFLAVLALAPLALGAVKGRRSTRHSWACPWGHTCTRYTGLSIAFVKSRDARIKLTSVLVSRTGALPPGGKCNSQVRVLWQTGLLTGRRCAHHFLPSSPLHQVSAGQSSSPQHAPQLGICFGPHHLPPSSPLHHSPSGQSGSPQHAPQLGATGGPSTQTSLSSSHFSSLPVQSLHLEHIG